MLYTGISSPVFSCHRFSIRAWVPSDSSTSSDEQKCYKEFEALELSQSQKRTIEKWVDAIDSQNSIYSTIAFRLEMQHCFSLLRQLAGLK